MKKTIYTLFLMLALLSSFFMIGNINFAKADVLGDVSATNAFRILRHTAQDGQISLSYIFPVNSKQLQEVGFSEVEIKTYRFYLVTFVNALAQQYKQKEVEGVEISACTYYTDVDGIGFAARFEDIDAQKKFFGIQDSQEDEEDNKANTKKTGFLMKKTTISTTFAFSSKEVAQSYCSLCKMATNAWCENNAISADKQQSILKVLDEAVYIYDFSSYDGSLKSELNFQADGVNHNVFIKNMDEIEADNQIVFWTIVPNVPVWYALALVVVLAGMLIAYLIRRNKTSKKTRK